MTQIITDPRSAESETAEMLRLMRVTFTRKTAACWSASTNWNVNKGGEQPSSDFPAAWWAAASSTWALNLSAPNSEGKPWRMSRAPAPSCAASTSLSV